MGFKYYLSQRGKKYHIRLTNSFNKGSRHDFMIGVYLKFKKHFNSDDIEGYSYTFLVIKAPDRLK